MRKLMAVCSVSLVVLCGAVAAKADTCSSVKGNLVSNCGFETGNFNGWSGSSTMANANGNFNGVDPVDPYQGIYAAYLGAASPEYTAPTMLTQTLATVAGQNYNLQFYLDNSFPGSTAYPNSFSVNFGNSVLFAETDVAASPYTLYSIDLTASSNATLLSFNTFNQSGFFALDDVAVTTTPEPSSLLLMGTGLAGALGVARRRLRA